ncbi:MAG TPA: hypothetical protein VGZ48_14855 [Candidatus Acidoferrales bacterium]|jgi:hypothetical protein|nr:hypothetical protein [Candidatus Acidoferrales bacterium]
MQRPAGVTVIAVLDFIGGAFCALFGLLAFAGGSFLSGWLATANAGVGSGVAAGIGAVIGVVFLAIGALAIITGIGLLKLKGWGRVIELVLAALGVLGSIKTFATGGLHAGGTALVIQIIELAYFVWVLWYLFTPAVKAAFAGQPAQQMAQPS